MGERLKVLPEQGVRFVLRGEKKPVHRAQGAVIDADELPEGANVDANVEAGVFERVTGASSDGQPAAAAAAAGGPGRDAATAAEPELATPAEPDEGGLIPAVPGGRAVRVAGEAASSARRGKEK